MKKITIAFVLTIVAGTTYAQGWQRDHGDIKMHVQRMDSLLDLTDEQEAKLEAIHAQYSDSMATVRSTRDCAKVQQWRQTKHKEVMAILTVEQRALLATHRKERREAYAGMRKELKELHETRFRPVLKKKRKAFDKALSADEKYTIEMARAEIEVCMNMYESDSSSLEEPMHMFMKGPGFMKWMPADVRMQLQAIINNHDSILQPILEEMKAEHLKLQPEIDAIKEKYGHHKGHKHGGQGMHRGRGNKGNQDQGDWLVYYFLLMEV